MEPTFLFKLLKLIRSSIFDLADYPLFLSSVCALAVAGNIEQTLCAN